MEMRRPSTFALCCFALTLLGLLFPVQQSFAEPPPESGPAITFELQSLDFGEVSPLDNPQKSIQIKNSGNEDLEIKKIVSTCFCTLVENATLTVPPGGSVEIPVKLSLSEYGGNTIRSFVTFESNAVNEPVTRVAVTGTVIPELLIDPPQLDFGSVKRGVPVVKAIMIRRNGIEGVEIEEVKAGARLATAVRDVDGGYAVVVQYRPGDNDSRLNTHVTVVTNIERTPEIQIPVRAEVVGVECTITPKLLVFDSIAPGALVGTLEVAGKYDLEILDASCTGGSFTCSVDVIDEAKRYRVTVRAADSAKSGDIFATLHLKVKEGELTETRKVTVFGTIE